MILCACAGQVRPVASTLLIMSSRLKVMDKTHLHP